MAVAVASQTSSNWALLTDGSTDHIDFTMTKPTGVAIGDLLVAITSRDIGDPGTDTPPTGWTRLREDNNTGAHYLAVYYKYATPTEVAASSFTWTWYTVSANMAAAGAIFRITGSSTGVPIWTSASDATIDNTAAPSFNNTITPAVADSLLMLIASGYQNNNAIGGYAIATSNPTWTEVLDVTANTGTDHSLSIATATRTQVTATGNSSITGGDTTADWVGTIIAISPDKSSSTSESVTVSDTMSNLRGRLSTIVDSVASSDTVSSLLKKWRNVAKSVSEWTNQPKS